MQCLWSIFEGWLSSRIYKNRILFRLDQGTSRNQLAMNTLNKMWIQKECILDANSLLKNYWKIW